MNRSLSVSKPANTLAPLDVLAFLIGVLQCYTVPLIGALPLGEAAAVLCLPAILYGTRSEIAAKDYRLSYALIAIWGLAQFVSNVANQADAEKMVKGISAVLFVFFDLLVLRLLLRGRPKRQILFGVGLMLSDALRIYVAPISTETTSFSLADNWKFGWGGVSSTASALVCCYCFSKRKYLLGILLVIVAGSASLYYNARSLYLITVLSVCLVAPVFRSSVSGDAASVRRAGLRRFVVIIASVIVTGSLLGSIYSYTAATGLLGEEARKKYEDQALGSSNLFFVARPEVIPDLLAIRDSPLLGYGYHGVGSKYVAEYALREEAATAETGGKGKVEVDSDEIPSHSFLLNAWVWSGFFGTLFWFYALYLVIRSIFILTLVNDSSSPYLSFLMSNLVWNILASPFGSNARMVVAFTFVIMLDVIRRNAPRFTLRSLQQRKGPVRHGAYSGAIAASASMP